MYLEQWPPIGTTVDPQGRVMIRFIRSNAVGLLALFVALGGTGYAAMKLPKNSVGNAQLKTAAVNSRAVKNHSIDTIDLARGIRTAGPSGAQGPQGPQGSKGDQGALGPTEGGSSDTTPALTRQLSFDASPFTTQHSGKTLVSKSISSLGVTCTGGVEWAAWLEVDNTRVPGTFVAGTASGSTLRALTLTGVTTDALAAGPHTASFATECIGNTASGGSATLSSDVTYVVLGG
jgi:hypothetical protein